MKKKTYSEPSAEVENVKIEKGFAGSAGQGNTPGMTETEGQWA